MANKVYVIPEAATTWTDTTGDLAMTLNNLAAGTGRQGAQLDLGTAARADRYAWRAWFQAATTPVLDQHVDVRIKTSDGTNPDNDDGTGDIAVSAEDKLKNLDQIGSILVDEAATGVTFAASGLVILTHRFVMPVFWNYTADNFVATNNICGFSLIPAPYEIQ